MLISKELTKEAEQTYEGESEDLTLEQFEARMINQYKADNLLKGTVFIEEVEYELRLISWKEYQTRKQTRKDAR